MQLPESHGTPSSIHAAWIDPKESIRRRHRIRSDEPMNGERRSLVRHLPQDVLERPVDVRRVDDGVGVRRDREEGVLVRVAARLGDQPIRLDDRVVPIRLDPLARVGVLVGDLRLARPGVLIASAKDTISSGSVPAEYHSWGSLCTTVDACEHCRCLWRLHLESRGTPPCAPRPSGAEKPTHHSVTA